jgi:hypothetical protein
MTDEQHETLETLKYTGSTTVRVYGDGSWLSPADATRTQSDDGSVVAVWTGRKYKVRAWTLRNFYRREVK